MAEAQVRSNVTLGYVRDLEKKVDGLNETIKQLRAELAQYKRLSVAETVAEVPTVAVEITPASDVAVGTPAGGI